MSTRKPCKPKLTEQHVATIRCALIGRYTESMRCLNMHDEYGGFWLRIAGESWDAYKAIAGYSLTYGETPR